MVPVLLLAVPIFDTCFVTIQRLSHGRHPFVGGTDHVSHRLAVLGLSTRQTVLALYVVSACLGALSVVSLRIPLLTAAAVWLLVFTLLTLFGLYLGKVRVYRLAEAPPAAAASRGGSITLIETMLLHKRRLLEILVDFCVLCSAYVIAYLLRFEGMLDAEAQRLISQSLPVLLVIKLACFAAGGLYRGVWRYLSLSDLLGLFRAVSVGSVLFAVALLYLWRFEGYSRAVLIIDWMLSLIAVGGSRITERLLDEAIQQARVRGTPVLIIGAGDVGARVLRSLKYEGVAPARVIGFLDDDLRKHRSRIHGVDVLGSRARLAELLDGQGVREVLVAIDDPPGDLLEHVRSACEPRGVAWKVVTAGVSIAS
jgi:UDP-GlcNAc:undecaprenyl-phosphate GlcNAc-1-phosphate transferase